MNSGLDPLFPALPPRQAEPADTRQDIRRGEVRDERRRKDKSGANPDSDLFEDNSPRVSILALIALLEDLLFGASPDSDVCSPSGPESARTEPVSGQAAMAARAYRHAGEPCSLAESVPLPASPSSRPALDAQDVETIRGLLPILRDLSA